MGNILNIAKKEYVDLLSNKLVIVILLIYIFIAVVSLYSQYDYTFSSNYTSYSAMNYLSLLAVFLTDYGSLIALAIGFFAISNELRDHTINTLLVKPLYRDTVINGKLLGATAFLLSVILGSTIFYTAGLLMVYGDGFSAYIMSYFIEVPAVILISLIYVMIFFSISMFLSIIIKEDIFALFACVLVWFFFLDILPNVLIAGNLSLILQGGFSSQEQQVNSFIALLSPASIRAKIFWNASDIFIAISQNMFEVVKLLLYMILATVSSYIAFIRRDIS